MLRMEQKQPRRTINSLTYVNEWLKISEFKESKTKVGVFSFCCYFGRENMFKILMKREDVIKVFEYEYSYFKMQFTSFQWMILGRKVSVNDYMYKELFKLYKDHSKHKFIFTHLGMAAYVGSLPIVKSLLSVNDNSINIVNDSAHRIYSPLYPAIMKKDMVIVKELLKHPKFNVNVKTSQQKGSSCSYLYLAIKFGTEEMVKMLLEKENINLNLDNKGYNDFTPLSLAIEKGNNKLVKMLLKHKSIDVNLGRVVPLCVAVMKKNIDAIKLLIKHPKINVNKCYGFFTPKKEERPRGMTPLAMAIIKNNLDIASLLLQHKDIDFLTRESRMFDMEECAFFAAIEVGNLEFLKKILAHKNLNLKKYLSDPDKYLITPFYYSCKCGMLDIAKFFFSKGDVKIHDKRRNNNPLRAACRNGHFHVVKWLLQQKGVDINDGEISYYGANTPLMLAYESKNMDLLSFIIKHKDIDIKKGNLLAKACEKNELNIVKLLLKHKKGLEVNKIVHKSKSLLEIAAEKGNLELIKVLLSYKHEKVDVNAGKHGAISYASVGNHWDIVQYLLTIKGIVGNRKTHKYDNILGLAIKNNIKDVVVMLLRMEKKGIDVDIIIRCIRGKKIEILKEIMKRKDFKINTGTVKSYIITAVNTEGGEKIVCELLKRKDLEVNAFDSVNKTALYYACKNVNVENVKSLLNFKTINVNWGEKKDVKDSPLSVICSSEKISENVTKIVSLLIQKKGIIVEGTKALEKACENGHLEAVKILLNVKNIKIDPVCLINSCKKGFYEIAKLILPKIRTHLDSVYVSSLQYACRNTSLNLVMMLLNEKKKFDANITKAGDLFKSAANAGNEEIVKLLIERGDIIVKDDQCISDATRHGRYSICKLLLGNKSVRENVKNDYYISDAMGNNHVELVKEYLKCPKVNFSPYNDRSGVLKVAIHVGCIEIVNILLKRKEFDVNKFYQRAAWKRESYYSHVGTALYIAIHLEKYDIAHLLLQHPNIDVNLGRNDDFKNTPLRLAIKKGNVEMVKALLEFPTISIVKGKTTPLFVAVETLCESKNKCFKVIDHLLDHEDILVDSPTFQYALKERYNHSSKVIQFHVLKRLIKRMSNEQNELFEIALEHFCKYNWEDSLIVLLQRNVKFNKKKVYSNFKVGYDYNKNSKELLDEFLLNKSAFRHKYKQLDIYDIGFDVREYVKVGFVVGNSKYEHLTPLNTTVNDAKEISESLKKNQFSIVKLIENNEYDDLLDEFEAFIYEVKEIIKKEENKYKSVLIFFFYSGHGIAYESESFILPIDFNEKSFKQKELLYKNALSMSKLKNGLSSISMLVETVNIVVLDACRTVVDREKIAKMIESMEKEKKEKHGKKVKVKTRGDSSSFVTKKSRDNYVFCFSTDPNSVAMDKSLLEGEKSKNSPFTLSLLENIDKRGNFEDLIKNVRNKTMYRTHYNQKPWINSSLSFPVMWNDDLESVTQFKPFSEVDEEVKKENLSLKSKLKVLEKQVKFEKKKNVENKEKIHNINEYVSVINESLKRKENIKIEIVIKKLLELLYNS